MATGVVAIANADDERQATNKNTTFLPLDVTLARSSTSSILTPKLPSFFMSYSKKTCFHFLLAC
jgi:hypothetical protein